MIGGGAPAAPERSTGTGRASAAALESTSATASISPAAPDVGAVEWRSASSTRRTRAARGGPWTAEAGATGDAEARQANTGGAQTSCGRHTKRTGNWIDTDLEQAMNSITDDAMSLRQASRVYGIPTSSLRDHLFGKTRSRQKGIKLVLAPHEEKKVVDYVFQMQDLGHPLTAAELCLKVATATQTRSTPWSASGVPGKGWLCRFHSKHPKISTRRSQGLEVARAHALCPITAESLYANLETLYTAYNYPPSHIWNCDESGVQAGRSGGATVLACRGSRSVHSIEPNQKEHLSVLSCINADGGCIPNFYILKGCYFLADYIVNCEEGVAMGMQPNAWMTRWLFESWISHFIECLKRGPRVDLSNRHLLILDKHNSHVTLQVVKISMELGLDIISLPSHTSHALQPLDIARFKPFKTAFRQIRDAWCLANKNEPVGKQTLCEWTSKALKRALTPTNIKSGFRGVGIWPLDREASKASMLPSRRFHNMDAGQGRCAVTTPAGREEGGVTYPTGHPYRAGGAVTS